MTPEPLWVETEFVRRRDAYDGTAVSRVYRVAPQKVWLAWTDPQALSQWFGSGKPGSVTAAEFDLRVGGRYRIAFTCLKGEAHEVSGVYQELVPQRRLVFSWAWKSTPERVSRVSIDFEPTAEGTQMIFVHDRFFDTAARNNHQGGWLPMFDQLEYVLHLSPLLPHLRHAPVWPGQGAFGRGDGGHQHPLHRRHRPAGRPRHAL